MAKNRLVYGMVAITLLVFIVLRELPMTYWALYALWLVPIVSMILALVSQLQNIKQGASVTAELSSNYVEKGTLVPYVLTIQNSSFIPYSCIRLRFQSDEVAPIFDHDECSIFIPARKSKHVTVHVSADYRGSYLIEPSEMVLYDGLGLFRWKKRLPPPLCLTVVPRVYKFPPLPLDAEVQEMAVERNQILQEDYSAVSDLRKHQPSDGYRKIHWKASAKRNELISKHFRETEDHTVFLCIDNRVIQPPKREALILEDQMMDALVSAMAYCTERGYTVGLDHLGTNHAEPVADFNYLFQTATHLKFEESGDFDTYLTDFFYARRAHRNLILFLQNITARTVSIVQSHRASMQNVIVFHFSDTEETQVAELQKSGVSCIDFCSVIEKEMSDEKK